MPIDLVISTRNDNPLGLYNSLLPISNLIQSGNIIVYVVNDSDRPLSQKSLPSEISSIVKVIDIQKRLGLAHALNVGISIGSSDLIARLDVGDKSSPDRFLEQKSFLQNNKDISLVGIKSILNFYDSKGRKIHSSSSKGPLSNSETIKQFKKCNPIVHGSIMFRRACFNEVDGYDEKLIVAQDFGLYMKLYRSGFKFKVLDGPFHSHDFYQNKSNTMLKNKLSRLNAMKLRLRYFFIKDFFSASLISSFIKDLIMLSFPSIIMAWIKRVLIR